METREPQATEPAPAESLPEVEEAFDEIEVDTPRVGIVIGSQRDKPVMQPAGQELRERNISYEVRVLSCHREPERVADYARNAHMRGIMVIIAGAGLGAALPGMVAAHTDLPVIGVPIRADDAVGGGLDALLSVAQMPAGTPVACMGVNGARNAAIFAARILGR